DLFAFVWVADPQMSPDGSRVAFIRITADERKDAYETTIWLARTDGREPPRQLTRGPRDKGLRWSPDGKHLAFDRSIDHEGGPKPSQIFVLALDGGEARAITEIPRGAASPQWSPDGRTIAFSASARPNELNRDDEKKEKPRESDVRVITEAVYRANGAADFGYVDRDRPSHIWTVTVPDGAAPLAVPQQVTSGDFSETNFRFSPDGARLFFVSNPVKEPYYVPSDSDLYSVPASGGEATRVVSIDGTIGDYAFSPDAARVAFVGTLHGAPVRSYSQSDLFVADLASGAPRNLTASYDFDVDGGLGGDQRAPRGGAPSGPVWSRDGTTLVIKVGEQGDAVLKRVDAATGRIEALTRGHHDVMAYTADASGQKLALILSTQTVLGNVQVLDASTGAMSQLTAFNDELFNQLALSEPEEMWYTGIDGKKIQGWILKPSGFDASKKYPMILEIHGGPHSAYGNTFTHEFQWMAAKGYVVLFTNPRGSSNYGQEFGNIIQFKYPGDDYKDLMAGVDEILKKGYVDEARRSPITHVKSIQTPLMFILGDEDWRTPPSAGGEQLFRALKYLKRPTVMVRFPDENHELSRSGKPWHRVERLQHIVGWMDKYLMGKKIETY
ncbi:MAG: S9 family peptidase, partial [Acidobacteria bacterium]|nr:S9 family peptidase [Acidobacteriota bacterium]